MGGGHICEEVTGTYSTAGLTALAKRQFHEFPLAGENWMFVKVAAIKWSDLELAHPFHF